MFDGFEEGKVGYIAVILINLPLQKHTAVLLCLFPKLINQRGLSNAGIAADGNKRPGTGCHFLEVILQLGDFGFPSLQPVSEFKAPAEILFAKNKLSFPLTPCQIIKKTLTA